MWTNSKRIELIKILGASLVREVASRTNDAAGDGTVIRAFIIECISLVIFRYHHCHSFDSCYLF